MICFMEDDAKLIEEAIAAALMGPSFAALDEESRIKRDHLLNIYLSLKSPGFPNDKVRLRALVGLTKPVTP